ncbi:advanced glycosylation end product-specific receptor-like isoform X2 [Pristis pectinata]|uniref:advanced glycosylation end product-specific receptor-like isoform X2 n=1 Tax=Pristis pectinata TaxID=685728 RepID=UPI00223DC5AB|nr:advanced glycosylation end product-specific receptor-like isoform X2 [Pristis pectinata]
MKWSRKSTVATLCICWLQVVLQAAATETGPNVINGTISGNIFLAAPVTGTSEQIQTVEWKYSDGSASHYVGKLILDAGNSSTSLFHYSHRAYLYPNGSLSLRNVQMNDSGTYSCTVANQNGEEFTQSTKVNVIRSVGFGRIETPVDEKSPDAEFNLTHHVNNKGYTSANCAYLGVLIGIAVGLLIIISISIWAVVRSCRSRRQDKRNKAAQSYGIKRSTNDDIYEKMGKVPE